MIKHIAQFLNDHDHIKPHAVALWVAAMAFVIWVHVKCDSIFLTGFVVATTLMPVMIYNSMFGTKDDPEED